MSALSLALWLHLVLGVLVTGLALFWAVMALSLRRAHPAPEADRLLAVAAAARWPHVAVPASWRLPLPLVSAAALVVASGIGVGLPAPLDALLIVKLVLCAGLLVVFLRLARRPSAALGHAALALALGVVALSTFLGR
jgi:hypothetical protein